MFHLDRGANKSFHDVHVDVGDVVPDDQVVDVLPHLLDAVEAELVIVAEVEQTPRLLPAAAK